MTRAEWIRWIIWQLETADDEELERIYYLLCGFLTRPQRRDTT